MSTVAEVHGKRVTLYRSVRGFALAEQLNPLPVTDWGLLTVYWELDS